MNSLFIHFFYVFFIVNKIILLFIWFCCMCAPWTSEWVQARIPHRWRCRRLWWASHYRRVWCVAAILTYCYVNAKNNANNRITTLSVLIIIIKLHDCYESLPPYAHTHTHTNWHKIYFYVRAHFGWTQNDRTDEQIKLINLRQIYEQKKEEKRRKRKKKRVMKLTRAIAERKKMVNKDDEEWAQNNIMSASISTNDNFYFFSSFRGIHSQWTIRHTHTQTIACQQHLYDDRYIN